MVDRRGVSHGIGDGALSVPQGFDIGRDVEVERVGFVDGLSGLIFRLGGETVALYQVEPKNKISMGAVGGGVTG